MRKLKVVSTRPCVFSAATPTVNVISVRKLGIGGVPEMTPAVKRIHPGAVYVVAKLNVGAGEPEAMNDAKSIEIGEPAVPVCVAIEDQTGGAESPVT